MRNNSDAAATLTGVRSPACGMVMLHDSETVGGMDTMAQIAIVSVPAHSSMTFAPGGYHLMCMMPSAAMKPGVQVPVTLQFSDDTRTSAKFAVKDARGR